MMRRRPRLDERSALGGRALAVAAFGVLALCALALASCNWVDPFEGYYDPTVNFIAASGLDRTDLTTAGFESPASWTWAWRGEPDAQAGTGFDYMRLEDGGTVSAPEAQEGLPSGTPWYRLTLVNLVSDGDFEGGYAIDPAVWRMTNASSFFIEDTSAIHGYSATISAGPSEYVHFALNSLKDSAGASPHDYRLSANSAHSNNDCRYQIGSFLGNPAQSDGLPAFQDGGITLLISDILNSEGKALIIGRDSPSTITIDDLRANRTDMTSRLRLRLRSQDTSPKLTNGYYEFSLWIRKPALMEFARAPNANAPSPEDDYAAESVSLYMTNQTNGQGSDQQEWAVPDDAAWHRLVLRQDMNFTGLNIDSAEALIELAIAPFSDANPEPGAIDIAQPELRFYLNGYGQ